jgi:NAD(P)-dependent dehydrogenase (short-subunit alcohol dehydrogenase family)
VTEAAARVVLVTGGSSGIGLATALALAAAGDHLMLLARAEGPLAAAAARCRSAGAASVTTVAADVRDAAAVTRAVEQLREAHGRLDVVVHCAGVAAYGRFEDVPAEVFDQALATTLGGAANVSRCALQAFEQDGGRLVVVGSLLGKISTPFMSSYVTAKWGVHGLVRTLQIESRTTPHIDISLVWPGGVDTPVYLQAGTYLGRHGRPPPPVDPPEKVARRVVSALDRPRREVSVGPANRIIVAGFHLFPAVFDLLVTPLMRLGGLSREETTDNPGNVLSPSPEGEAVHGRWGRHWLRPAAGVAAFATAGAVRRLTSTRS